MHTTNPQRSPTPPVGDAPTTTPAAAPPERLLRLAATLETVGLGRSCWLDLVKAGRAPQPIKIGRATAWAQSEIQAWIESRIRARTGSR
jgi:prophage regulatory protein